MVEGHLPYLVSLEKEALGWEPVDLPQEEKMVGVNQRDENILVRTQDHLPSGTLGLYHES